MLFILCETGSESNELWFACILFLPPKVEQCRMWLLYVAISAVCGLRFTDLRQVDFSCKQRFQFNYCSGQSD